MKKKLIAFCAMLSVILMSTSVANALVTLEPDDFAAGTDISNAFWGVTLSSRGSGWNMPSSDKPIGRIIAVDPPSLGGSNGFTPSTGNRAFGTDDGDYPHLFAGKDTLLFRADFTSALATVVKLDFIGNDVFGNGDIGELAAYDAGGNLLTSAMSSLLQADEWETVTVSWVTGIAYIEAYGNTGNTMDTIGIDRMQWEAIPAPGAILLGSLGVGLVGWLRRRRTL